MPTNVSRPSYHDVYKKQATDAGLPKNLAESIARKLDKGGKMSDIELQAAEGALIKALGGNGKEDAASILFQNVAGAKSPLILPLQAAPLELALIFDKLQEKGLGTVGSKKAKLTDIGTESADGKTRSYEAHMFAKAKGGRTEEVTLTARFFPKEGRLTLELPVEHAKTMHAVLDKVGDRLGLPAWEAEKKGPGGSRMRFTLEQTGAVTTGVG